jgi:hypothetical protein
MSVLLLNKQLAAWHTLTLSTTEIYQVAKTYGRSDRNGNVKSTSRGCQSNSILLATICSPTGVLYCIQHMLYS